MMSRFQAKCEDLLGKFVKQQSVFYLESISKKTLHRRDFLRGIVITMLGFIAAACGAQPESEATPIQITSSTSVQNPPTNTPSTGNNHPVATEAVISTPTVPPQETTQQATLSSLSITTQATNFLLENRSEITLTLSEANINDGFQWRERAGNYAVNAMIGRAEALREVGIPIKTVTIDNDKGVAVITTTPLVPDGAQVLLKEGVLLDKNGGYLSLADNEKVWIVNNPEIDPTVGFLAHKPFVLGQGTPTDGIPYIDVEQDPEGSIREYFNGFNRADLAEKAIEIFNYPEWDQVGMPVKLKAGLTALLGTFAEPAIELYRQEIQSPGNLLPAGSRYKFIGFGTPPEGYLGGPLQTAQVSVDHNDSDAFSVFFGDTYKNDVYWPLYAQILAHEVLHTDLVDSIQEEYTAKSLDTRVYMQLLLRSPQLFHEGSPMSQKYLQRVVDHYNSGKAKFPFLGIFQSPGNPEESFADKYGYFSSETGEGKTPANAALRAYLSNLDYNAPISEFGQEALDEFLDSSYAPFTLEELIGIAEIIDLRPTAGFKNPTPID